MNTLNENGLNLYSDNSIMYKLAESINSNSNLNSNSKFEAFESQSPTQTQPKPRSRPKSKYYKKEKLIDQEMFNLCSNNYCTECKITNGYTCELTKDDPLISYLIDKRMNFCQLGPSIHIAALIPITREKGYGKLIIGENSNKPLYSNKKISTHAEMDALQKTKGLLRCKKLKNKKMNLIVIRITRSGVLSESAPCFHCTEALANDDSVELNKIFFSRSDGTITCIKFDDWIDNGTSHVSKGWKWLQRSNNKK